MTVGAEEENVNDSTSNPSRTQIKGAWEWNPTLATLRRAEAEEEFRQLLTTGDDSNDSNTDDINAEEGRPRTGDDDPPLSLIPPHARPRKRQRDYRCSALESNHDEELIPNLQIGAIASALPAAIERERLFEDGVLPLMGKQIWRYRGLDYDKSHPSEPALKHTPNDWAEDTDETGQPWPRGCRYESGVFTLCWAFFRFAYNKQRAVSIKVILCEVVGSFIPPACSYLFGTGLLDELNPKTSRGQDEETRILWASLYAIGILLLRILNQWLTVHYSNWIPTGAIRTGLRDMLFSRMQHLQSPLKDKLTPGAASGIIVDKVFDAVGIYYQFLTFPSLVVGILVNLAVSLKSAPLSWIPAFSLPTLIVILLSMILPVLINYWVQPEYCILTRLEHQWRLRLRSLAGSAIPREGCLYKSSRPTSDTKENTNDDSSTEKQETELVGVFHECVFIEKMRHWQAWKFSIVEGLLIDSLLQLGIAVVTISSAYVVIKGHIMVGNFTTLIGCVTSITSLADQIGSLLIGLYEKHMMLKQITAIMNDEDIDFDGGVDELQYVKDIGRGVSGQVTMTGKKVATATTHAAQKINPWAGDNHRTTDSTGAMSHSST